MPVIVVGLVTLFHANEFLPTVATLPYIERRRTVQNNKLKQLHDEQGIPLKHNYRDAPMLDSGVEVRQFRKKRIMGADLAPHLAEPRLIFVPDESPPKAKWKAEFRKKWPTADGQLSADAIATFSNSISASVLELAGIWRNPSTNTGRGTGDEWLNVVLSACRPAKSQPIAEIRFSMREGSLVAEWNET